MFSIWDSWIGSLGVVLFLGSLITGFAWLVTLLVKRIWGGEIEIASSSQTEGSAKTPSLKKAA